jgi:nucleotide-binding universal stress UspA family protein
MASQIKKILVPVDSSEGAGEAARWAAELYLARS